MLSDDELSALCTRIDDLMLGNVVIDGIAFQLDGVIDGIAFQLDGATDRYENLSYRTVGASRRTLDYRWN